MLAGGASRRFGRDKGSALLHGRRLRDHVHAALARHCRQVVICGPGGLPDRPGPGLGPLGGLAAALHHGAAQGFAAVLVAPCDTPLLPDLAALAPGPAVAAGLPVIGLWPVALAPRLDGFLAGGGRRVREWAALAGARTVDLGTIANVNTADDLARLTCDGMRNPG